MLSGWYPGVARGGTWIHALLGIFDLPARLRGTAFSGITFSRRVDTTYEEHRNHHTRDVEAMNSLFLLLVFKTMDN